MEFPVGSTVNVYYNPDDPREACLDPGVPGTIYEKLNIGLQLFLAGLAGVFIGWWVKLRAS